MIICNIYTEMHVIISMPMLNRYCTVSASIWKLRAKITPIMIIMNFMNPAVGIAPCNCGLRMNYPVIISMKNMKNVRK